MRTLGIFLTLGLSVLASYAKDKPNVLLICVDDLRPELGCYGVDYIHSPHIDQL
ncbi:MAG: iduronate-2-sulfatase, partial [Verrucomicrobiota bacterium]